jgi:hypothetical protein
MKTKLQRKKNTPAPSAASFLVMPADYKYPPRLKSLVEMAVSKFFPNVEGNAPKWAKRAAELAVASAMPPNRKRNASENYLAGFGCGELFGAAEMLPPAVTDATLFGIRYEREFYASLPSDEAADYYTGLRDGEKRLREMPEKANAFQRVKAFRAIAAGWREAEKFESSSQLHDWLLRNGAIVTATDSRETRKICKMIGLEYQNKWRKPKA